MPRIPPFPEASPGYDRDAVERFVEAAEREREELVRQLEETRHERDALQWELATLRGELDATKAAMPEIGELQARLEGMEGEYAERVRALETLLAFAAREAAERRAGDPVPEVPAPDGGAEDAVIRGAWSATRGPDDG